MALTFGTPTYWRLPMARGWKVGTIAITFDSSYASGGEAIAYTDVKGLASSLTGLAALATNDPQYTYAYDSTNGKLAVYDANSEASGDLSSLVTTFLFIGQ